MQDNKRMTEKVSDYLNRKRMEEGWREGRPISQSEMARRIGIAQGSLSQYERGTRLPDSDNLHKLATYFGVEFYDLVGEPRSIPNEPSLLEIIEAWAWLPKDVRKRFANLVKDEAAMWEERSRPKGATGKEVVAT